MQPPDPAETSDPRRCPDEVLLRACRVETFRGPGPGGQKRNKTSSAVRITHVPTGVCALATESRSQHDNRAVALRRLRHRIAVEIRRPVPADDFTLPAWFAESVAAGGRLRMSPRHGDYPAAAGLVLDVLAAAGGSVSDAARRLGLTTANLVDFLQRDDALLAQANRLRGGAGLRPLGA